MPPDNEVGPRDTTPEGTDTDTTPAGVNSEFNGARTALHEYLDAQHSAERTALHEYLQATVGDTEGYFHVVFTSEPYMDNGKYKHQHRSETAYSWPAEAEKAEREILTAAAKSDVYCCPYIMSGRKRAKWAAVTRTTIHADIDDMIDIEKVRTLGGSAVASGSHGHGHVYVHLAEPVTGPQHEALCRGLGKFLGGADAKISDNDILRPVSTGNFKSTVPGGPGFISNFQMSPGRVDWLVPPTERVLRTPDDLARQFKVKLPGAEVNGKPHTAANSTPCKPPDLAEYPAVQAALDKVSGDRSVDIYRVLGACRGAGFTSEEAFDVVRSRADLVEKLGEVGGDDLTRSWIKLGDEQQRLRFGGGDSDASAEEPTDHGKTAVYDEPVDGDEEIPATTWEPVDLGPYLRGEVKQPRPCVGIKRSDGAQLIYPGREHTVLGETESGKTWFALGCVAAELLKGNNVLYIHYEESDPGSTIERLRLLGVADAVIAAQLQFIGPARAARREWLADLLQSSPSLVVHDGVNEAMSLHGADIMAADGAAMFRRALIVPCTRTGAATLACDHLPKLRDPSRRDAYGSVHKGNALDGARFVLENEEPFGRGLRGVSHVFVTKDRPGHLRATGRPTKTPGKTFIGTLAVDDSDPFTPFEMPFYAPRTDNAVDYEGQQVVVTSAELRDIVHGVITALPDHTVGSMRRLFAEMRAAGEMFREHTVRIVVEDLVVGGRLVEVPGKRGANGYQAVLTAAPTAAEEGA